MAWKYLDDFKNLELGRRYKMRLMPDNREAMGVLSEVRILEGELNKGYLELLDAARFTVNEYQYIQYEEYDDKWTTYKRIVDEFAVKLMEDFPKVWN